MLDEAKMRFLFRKLQHTGLCIFIDSLKASQTTSTTILYTMVANHLSTVTYDLRDYIAMNAINVLEVQIGSGEKGGDGICNEDVSINT